MTLLMVCVVAYWLCYALLQIIVIFWEGDHILFTNEMSTARQPLAVRSTLPRFSDIYTLILAPKHTQKNQSQQQQQQLVKKDVSIAQFIYEDGTFAKDRFSQFVRSALREFETQQRNSTKKET
jgi:nicotinamidase-related amidase